MFRSTRDDTLIRTVEDRYGIDLHARGNTKLGNLLENRGFESLTQLLKAYRGELAHHACKRRIYICFHVEDLPQVRGFRLMGRAPNLEIEFHDGSLREEIDSVRGSYIKQQIRAIADRDNRDDRYRSCADAAFNLFDRGGAHLAIHALAVRVVSFVFQLLHG